MSTETLTKSEIKILEDLASRSADELYDLYRQAKTPKVEDLDGPLRGKMLAVPSLHRSVAANLLARFASSGRFPWQGKTFQSLEEGKGEGINRVLGDRYDWFRFETFIGPSRVGNFEAVQLNYDLPENPGLIRKIKDEVREVAPGVWLGLAYLQGKDKANMVLFFGLTNQPATGSEENPVKSESLVCGKTVKAALGVLVSAGALAWWLSRRKK